MDGGCDIGSYSSDSKEPAVLSLRVNRKLCDLYEEAHFTSHQGIEFIKEDHILHINYSTVARASPGT